MKAGNDVMIVACGSSVYDCLEAANILKSYGIDAMVVNMATIRPLDEDFLLYSLPFSKVVTVECHNIKRRAGQFDSGAIIRESYRYPAS